METSEEYPVSEEYPILEEQPVSEEHPVLEEYRVPEEQPASPQPTNPLNVGFALVAAFAIGLALGFWGRPQIISDVPIQVVVTVVPENSSETAAQAPASNSQPLSNSNSADSSTSVSEANPAAPQPEEAPASAQATPTIMDFVMADARHIQGDMDAPVTIIEFSDFK